MDELDQWYYVSQGNRLGPFTTEQMRKLIEDKGIERETLVWKVGSPPDWVPIFSTDLSPLYLTPPPLTGDAINNSIVWWLAFIPIIGLIIENIVAATTNRDVSGLWWITLVLNIALCVIDEKQLKKSGHDSISSSWALLIPLYLFLRAKKLRQKPTYAFVWLVTFAAIMFFPSQILYNVPALGGNQETISIVRDGNFSNHQEKTVGEVAKDFLGNPHWEAIVADDGKDYVNLDGDATQNGNNVHILMQFAINSDTNSFQVSSLEMGGEPQNKLVISEFVEKMFGT